MSIPTHKNYSIPLVPATMTCIVNAGADSLFNILCNYSGARRKRLGLYSETVMAV